MSYRDGDRTIKLTLVHGLALSQKEQRIVPIPEARPLSSVASPAQSTPTGSSARQAPLAGENPAVPIFKSETGELLAAVGGVLLVLDPEWRQRDVDAFLRRERLSGLATPLTGLPNSYSVHSEPGMEAVRLANQLSSRPGVTISAPNWWRRLTEK